MAAAAGAGGGGGGGGDVVVLPLGAAEQTRQIQELAKELCTDPDFRGAWVEESRTHTHTDPLPFATDILEAVLAVEEEEGAPVGDDAAQLEDLALELTWRGARWTDCTYFLANLEDKDKAVPGVIEAAYTAHLLPRSGVTDMEQAAKRRREANEAFRTMKVSGYCWAPDVLIAYLRAGGNPGAAFDAVMATERPEEHVKDALKVLTERISKPVRWTSARVGQARANGWGRFVPPPPPAPRGKGKKRKRG